MNRSFFSARRKAGKRLPVIITFVCLSLQASWAHAEDVNTMCPVLLDREASADYAIQYKGKEVRFCCSECIIEFQKHPEIYEAVLPQLQYIPFRTRVQLFMGDYGFFVLGGFLLTILMALRIHRLRNPLETPPETSTFLNGVLQRKISAAGPLMLLSGYLGFEVIYLQNTINDDRLKDEIHFATFHDFGFPPTPKRPDTPLRVDGSYYRGNDERSPKLFNNGNYRTGTFHVSLCDEHGEKINAGDPIRDRAIFIRFQIDRPPFTPDFLYDSEMMSTMFLTAQCEEFLGRDSDVADAVVLTETEPMQKWEAVFPIRAAMSCACSTEQRGIVYVCEKYYQKSKLPWVGRRQVGARFHYGIAYDLKLKDGVLQEDSDVYMGALYRTRKLPTWRVPMTEWFSHEPIPELPGENVTDPELLGLGEHIAKRQATGSSSAE